MHPCSCSASSHCRPWPNSRCGRWDRVGLREVHHGEGPIAFPRLALASGGATSQANVETPPRPSLLPNLNVAAMGLM